MATRFQITRCADLTSLRSFRDLIDRACLEASLTDEAKRYDLKLAVDEACTNIILHGYAGMDPGSIILNVEIDSQIARVTITDYGQAFEKVEIEKENASELDDHGLEALGLFFMHQLTDSLEYESSPSGNSLTLVKFL